MPAFVTIDKLPRDLIDNLTSLKYIEMTEVQAAAIPLIISGRDILVQAKTGSGKTATFGIPMIMSIDTDSYAPQALIMAPTRELAEQVGQELRRLARYKNNIKIVTLTGGTPMRPQMASLDRGAHIVVGTPGRLQDHLSRETLPLHDIKMLVLDEADRMLDMGFYEAIAKIISNLPRRRHTQLFSATFPDDIENLAGDILQNPAVVKVESSHQASTIQQIAYEIDKESRYDAVVDLLRSHRPKLALIFCNMKQDTDDLADYLYDHGLLAESINGNLDQRERNEALLSFANTSIPILVATDVASRGLDVKEIDLVINADLPHDPEVYIHRIGRTGRAGAKGLALSLYTPNQIDRLEQMAPDATIEKLSSLDIDKEFKITSNMVTLCIDGGKKNKLRAGDILGTLCKKVGVASRYIGKIDIFDRLSYVAVDKIVANRAYNGLSEHTIKKMNFRVWRM